MRHLRLTIAHGAIAAALLALPFAMHAQSGTQPLPLTVWSERVITAPTIDGVIHPREWTSTLTPLTFRLPGSTVTGDLRSMWSGSALYVAAELRGAGVGIGNSEFDIAIDEGGDGLTTGDPAVLVWANGHGQEFHYDGARRGFVRNVSANGFPHAVTRTGDTMTIELAIPYEPQRWEGLDHAFGPHVPMQLAAKFERSGMPGQYDTWPMPGIRDALTASGAWAPITFGPARPYDVRPPYVELAVMPDRPTPTQQVAWKAKASDSEGLDRIELRANGALVRACTATTICETATGPYPAGTTVRAEALAIDRNGNASVAATTFTVTTPPPVDQQPPGVPLLIQTVNPGTGTTAYLFWVNPSDADFAKVRIYRSLASGALGTMIATAWVAPYVDTNLNPGTTYWYTIRAVDRVGNESQNTAQVSVTPQRP